MAQIWYLKINVGKLKKGAINHSEFMTLTRHDRENNTMPLSWALADGLVEADVSEADSIDKLTIYAPGEMPESKLAKEDVETKEENTPKKKRFLVNKLGEIIRAKKTTE